MAVFGKQKQEADPSVSIVSLLEPTDRNLGWLVGARPGSYREQESLGVGAGD